MPRLEKTRHDQAESLENFFTMQRARIIAALNATSRSERLRQQRVRRALLEVDTDASRGVMSHASGPKRPSMAIVERDRT